MVYIDGKTKNFASYGKHFQEKLAYLIFADKQFAAQIFEVL